MAYWRRISIARSFTGKLFLGQRAGLTVNRLKTMFRQFFVSLNGSASSRPNGGTKFRARESAADWGERCAASRAFNGSSPTANLVSNIKEQGMS
jgi:hypothetical protein